MSPSWDQEDVGILLGAIKTRQKLPRTLVSDLEAVEHLEKENTGRIFFDCGGRPAWVAYALTKRAAGAAEYFSEHGRMLVDASVVECIEIFPFYLANAIRKRPSTKGIHSAAISITLPCGEWMDCLMRIEVMGTKIARDIFGAYMEAEDNHRD